MARLRGRLAWPASIAHLYFDLIEQAGVCHQLVILCNNEGIIRENSGVVFHLLPKVRFRINRMKDICREIRTIYQAMRDKMPKRRKGAEPKWATITLDIIALCDDIFNQTTIVLDKDDPIDPIIIRFVVPKILEMIEKIVDLLDLLPVEKNVPEAFMEAFRNDNV